MFKPSPAQQAYFSWIQDARGNAILEAVAGAGKTTTILNGCALMRGRVWIGVYNSKMGKELKEKIASNPALAGRRDLYTSTFHSAGYSALRFAFSKQFALTTDDKKVLKITQKMADQEHALNPLVNGVAKIVSMAKNRGIGALTSIADTDAWISMIEHFDLENDLPEDCDIRTAVGFAKAVLVASNDDLRTIDFDDMVYLPLQRKLRLLQHEWVLIDEAQDTNPTRRALATKLLAPNGRLVAVGDPRQAIFGFTGADNDALEQIATAFNCARLPLTITYRCPKAVVRHAKQWVNHIESGDTAPEGEFRTIDYADLLPNLKAGDAILCRYNKYLVNLCFKLIRAGMPAKIEGRSIGENLIRLATKWKLVKLDALDSRLDAYLEREVRKAMDNDQEEKADRLTDQVETLQVLIARARDQKIDTVEGLRTMILGMFADNTSSPSLITLCSAHKSKGLEWERVFLLGRSELMPSAFARKPWQVDQENNLIYVAVTRAKHLLVEVNGVVEEKSQKDLA
jgi:superfamily I DNA/RNA helicase